MPDQVYSDRQRAALAAAYHGPPHVSARDVARLAAEGKLRDVDGRRMAPFDANQSSIRSIAQRALTRRGDVGPELSERLLNTLARRAQAWARNAKTPREAEDAARALERIEKARPVLEDSSRAKPASVDSSTRGGLAGRILEDFERREAGDLSAPEPVSSTPSAGARKYPEPPPEPEPEPELSPHEQHCRDIERDIREAMAKPPPEPSIVWDGARQRWITQEQLRIERIHAEMDARAGGTSDLSRSKRRRRMPNYSAGGDFDF
jgi:hypothetical protein